MSRKVPAEPSLPPAWNPAEEVPFEERLRFGEPGWFSDLELLTVLLGSEDAARRALELLGGLPGLNDLRRSKRGRSGARGERPALEVWQSQRRFERLAAELPSEDLTVLQALAALVVRCRVRPAFPVLADAEAVARWLAEQQAKALGQSEEVLAAVGLSEHRRPCSWRHRMRLSAEEYGSELRHLLVSCHEKKAAALVLCRLRPGGGEPGDLDRRIAATARRGCVFFGFDFDYALHDPEAGSFAGLPEEEAMALAAAEGGDG